ncbi:MAG: transcription antitermination factor NusB [Coriobacteriia bacterium]|nr:transcription antitermination factor NusB [Coriobacteriia bacterium]
MPTTRLAPARRTALKLFSECRRREARARDLLRESPAMEALDPRDRALATRLVLGAVAARGELDRVVNGHLRARSALEPRVRDALRVAAFEVLYLDTPAQVAVSQGVELVRSASKRAAGLGNAVLRRVADEDAPALAAARRRLASGAVAVDDLRRAGALPEWLAARVLEDLGAEGAVAYASSALEQLCASVATNLAKRSAEETRGLLADAGCEPSEGPVPGSFVLGRPAALNATGLVAACDVLPCDLAAQEVVASIGATPSDQVLEVGQGRGTKSILLAAPGATLVSVEVDAKKSALAARRMEAAGVASRVTCVCDDGRELGRVEGSFDVVFVDAPCSGTGTLSRHPEIAWSLREDAVPGLAALQLGILRAAAARVRAGGRLAYSTCSVLREEDEAVVVAFLASPEGAGFRLASSRRTAIPGADRHFLALLERS